MAICKYCKKHFIPKWPTRGPYCYDPHCVAQWHHDIAVAKAAQQKEDRVINAEIDAILKSNWTPVRQGICEKCGANIRLNASWLCYECYHRISNTSPGDDWLIDDAPVDWMEGLDG